MLEREGVNAPVGEILNEMIKNGEIEKNKTGNFSLAPDHLKELQEARQEEARLKDTKLVPLTTPDTCVTAMTAEAASDTPKPTKD